MITAAEGGDRHAAQAVAGRVRFDQWLWAARFYRTRSLATRAITAGQARIDERRVKPAQPIRCGDAVTVSKAGIRIMVDVIALADRRGSATDAAKLYRETAESVAAREAMALQRRADAAATPRFPGRPTKRDRRALEDFLNEP